MNHEKNLDTLSNMATVWIYSIDGLDILGPYYVTCGNTLEVEIDDRFDGNTIRYL